MVALVGAGYGVCLIGCLICLVLNLILLELAFFDLSRLVKKN